RFRARPHRSGHAGAEGGEAPRRDRRRPGHRRARRGEGGRGPCGGGHGPPRSRGPRGPRCRHGRRAGRRRNPAPRRRGRPPHRGHPPRHAAADGALSPMASPAPPPCPSLLGRAARRLRREGLRKMARTRRESRNLLREAGKLVTAPMRLVDRRSHTIGLPPGTMVADPLAEPPPPARLSVLHYDGEHFEELGDATTEQARRLAEAPGVTWVNLDGVRDLDAVARLGTAFGLHPLVQEDLTHTTQRPKADPYDGYLFVLLKMVR